MIDDRDKLNMDSPYFDPEKALTQILADNNVPQLVNKCNELQIGKPKTLEYFFLLTFLIRYSKL